MLEFKQNDTTAELILTLTENVTLPQPWYLFVFKHVLTKNIVAFLKSPADDESFYSERYNMFTINPSVVFADMPPGEWHYSIYEQPDSLNFDVLFTHGLLENGKLIIERALEFQFKKYESETSFKTYNG